MRQNDRKNDGVPKNVYWPIGLKMFHKWFWATFERKLKFEHFCPGEVIVRQKDIKKLWRTKRFLLAHWFGNVPQIIVNYFWAKTKIWKFCPGEVRVRQNDRKNDGVPKNVYWPIGLKMFHKWFWATFERKLKFQHFCPGVIVRQNDIKKIIAYQKIFIGPLVWKCSRNDFELLLSKN